MSGEEQPSFGIEDEVERILGESYPELRELELLVPDAFEMLTSIEGEKGLYGQELADYWDNIGAGQGGFYDDIRKNGCSSCGSHTPAVATAVPKIVFSLY